MIVRLRSRDGLERVEVVDGATLGELKGAIHAKLGIPLGDMVLSCNPALLNTKEPSSFQDLLDESAPLATLGVKHGTMVYLLYHFERQVEPAYKRKDYEMRQFGLHATVASVAEKWVRIERQEAPDLESVSFDRHAAHTFQSYVQAALAFSIKRGGLLYGSVDEAKNVRVEFVYEPPQSGTADSLELERHTPEEQQVDTLMAMLGLRKVGWIFAQSHAERLYIMSGEEVRQMAAMQAELGDEHCVTVLVSWDAGSSEGGAAAAGHVHFEAFMCSRQAVSLWRGGWLQADAPGAEPSGVLRVLNPAEPHIKQPAIVAGNDTDTVDVDWFLCPLKILDHEGPLLTSFPVENRLIPQTKADLRDHLRKFASRPYELRLADGHLLLWLSKQPNLDAADMSALLESVKEARPLMEGYRVILDSIAGV